MRLWFLGLVVLALNFSQPLAFSQATPVEPTAAPASNQATVATPTAPPSGAPSVSVGVSATPAFPARSVRTDALDKGAASSAQLGLYLFLLLALLGAGVYLLKNGFTFLQPRPKGPRKLDISETRMLGNRQFLIVAQYENRKMLLGVCPGRIDYLCTLSGAEPEFPQISPEDEK